VGGLGVLPGSAIGLALITVVGQCVGAGDYKAVKTYTRKLMKVTYMIMGVLNLIIIFLIPFILHLYGVSEETSGIATRLLVYHCILAALIWPTSFSLPNALRAANDVKFTMWTSMVSMWVWRIGFSYVLAGIFHMGVLGVWIAMTIDWLFRSICFLTRFHKEKYRRNIQI
jgi:Na+-driven multidrug efflux pump